MKILFSTYQLSLRGTEIAVFNYADHNEKILGNESYIIARDPEIYPYSHPLAIKKFQDRFPNRVYFYKDWKEVEDLIKRENISLLYMIKSGENDGLWSNNCKTVIHSVFQNYQPHGQVYSYVSEWLGRIFNSPFVPHMIDLPNVDGDLKEELNIPKNSLIFGRYGGSETFNIDFTHQVINDMIKKRDDIYFLFMYTDKFCPDHKQIIHLDGNPDLEYKVKFIQTCDAMIHSRSQGESFGLSCSEFSVKNKPVITFNGGRDQAHLEMLGDKCIKYNNYQDLYNIFNAFIPQVNKDWNAFRNYDPQTVMNKFKSVFID